MNVPDSLSLRPAQFSLALWVQWTDHGTDEIQFITAKGIENYELHTGGGAGVNGLRFIPAGFIATSVDAPNALHSGWNHIVLVYTGSTARIYIDGNLAAERTGITGGADLSTDAQPFRLGLRGNSTYPFHGMLDDVRFYSRALSTAEIAALASGQAIPSLTLENSLTINGDLTLNGAELQVAHPDSTIQLNGDWRSHGGAFQPNGSTLNLTGLRTQLLQLDGASPHHLTVDDHLRGYWNLDEGSGTHTADESGNQQTAALNGSPAWQTTNLPTFAFPNPAGLSFNAATNAFASGTATALPSGSHALSVFAWVRTITTDRATAFSYGAANANQTVSLNINQITANGHFVVDFYGNYAEVDVAINDGNWHLIGFALPENSTTLNLYVDGVTYPRTLSAVPNIANGSTFYDRGSRRVVCRFSPARRGNT